MMTMKNIDDSSAKNQNYLDNERNDLMMKKLELENQNLERIKNSFSGTNSQSGYKWDK